MYFLFQKYGNAKFFIKEKVEERGILRHVLYMFKIVRDF